MAATDPDLTLFGVRQVDLTSLLDTGCADGSAIKQVIDNPQIASFTFVYEDGETFTLRGGDGIVARIEEDDTFIGVDMVLTTAQLMPDIDEIMVGGLNVAEKWTSPVDSSEDAFPFEMDIWVQQYTESESASRADEFVKITLSFCKGRKDTWGNEDKAFGVQSYTVRCRINECIDAAPVAAMEYDKVAAIT